MATIYRFIIEQKQTQARSGSGRNSTTSSTKVIGKNGKDATTNLFGIIGMGKGGVEHNRYMRAINPVLNKATGGVWEKGVRIGRAAAGMLKVSKTTGAIAGVSAVAITIIISFILQTIMKHQRMLIEKTDKINTQNYKMLENGGGVIHGSFEISTNWWSGKHTYNQNK